MMVDDELTIKPQFLSRFFHALGTDHPRSHRLQNMIRMIADDRSLDIGQSCLILSDTFSEINSYNNPVKMSSVVG